MPLVPRPSSLPPRSSFDLLRVPLLGRFLKWRHARLAMQVPLVALAGVLILDGLRGPQVGPMNLAGVLPWIHWRGLLILSLLAVGNCFCLACPFLVPRTLARRWLPTGRSWPRWLRSKWLAVVLLVLFLWAYEAFSLWDSPWWTAWLTLGYFALAFVIDSFFRGAAFCKYLCPIGQFNFVQSLVSPLEVKVRDPEVCGRVGPRIASAAGTGFPVANCTCSNRARPATWTAPFASTAFTPALMTTSAYQPDRLAATFGTTREVPASASSVNVPTWQSSS